MSRRAENNRNNARLSTGPRSSAGKARSRMNARQHGLAAKDRMKQFSDDIRELSLAICGHDADPYRRSLADTFAHSACEFRNTSEIREQLLADLLNSPESVLTQLRRLERYHQVAFSRQRAAVRELARLDLEQRLAVQRAL